MNWGGFAGGFAQGFNQTFDSKGLTRYMLSPERRKEQVLAQGMEQASAARDADIGNMIQSSGIAGQKTEAAPTAEPAKVDTSATPAVAPEQTATTPATPAPETSTTGSGIKAIVADQTTPATPAGETPVAKQATNEAQPAKPATPAAGGLPYTVNGKGYATMDEARAAAEKATPSVTDYLYKKAMPSMIDGYIANGMHEEAANLQKFVESKRGQEAVNSYGKAMNKLMFTNDVDGGVKALGDYYTKYVDDGVDFVKGEIGQDGKINITTRAKDGGKEDVISLSKGDLMRMGMAYNPGKLLEMNLIRADEAEKAQAKTKADIAKEDRTFNRDIEKMTIEKQLDAANIGAKERRAMNTKIEALRAAGYSEDFINRSMPAILGIGDKKATSPDEARRLAYADRLKSDPMFGRKSKEERDRIISEDMGIVFAGGKPSDMPAAPAPATPAAAGLPKAGKGIPVFDTKTNTIIYK